MATPTVPATPEQFLRVEKGHAEPEELAAITALLMARAAAPGTGARRASRTRTRVFHRG
ncbi:acyl-CoA carboxylase subunit epsilon, partial [Streptomyces albidoflavus]|nr:acyl-CoA carboxylase subunit epsilon [Streptomyces albidoflavus]